MRRQPTERNLPAYTRANLPNALSESEISDAFRLCWSFCVPTDADRRPSQGGASRSQADVDPVPDTGSAPAWLPRQGLAAAAAGAAKCSLTYATKRLRSPGDAKGR
jgi:hypothetical protein